MWPEGDDDAGHVVTSCPVARCVGGQTVIQQLLRGHMEFIIRYVNNVWETTKATKVEAVNRC